MSNPYSNLDAKAFWKLAVAAKHPLDINDLWDPKFKLKPDDKVVTFGSCFAQHIGRALSARGFNWLSCEPPPHGLSASNQERFNYQVFSARTGNIYTASLLQQWTEWALALKSPPPESWPHEGRYIDPFRPNVEPGGFVSEDELAASQAETVAAFRRCIESADYFVFTLGLTERWLNVAGQYEYPMCPGTLAGTYSEQQHQFDTLSVAAVMQHLMESFKLMRRVNKRLKFILTVSPVPLTATNAGKHVLLATMESKSILRAAAGQLAAERGFIDYFPSYEIINSPVFRGQFFEPNQRSVNHHGVRFVMDSFFEALQNKFGAFAPIKVNPPGANAGEVCEEALLDAFGK